MSDIQDQINLIDALSLDDNRLLDDKGFPTETLRRAVVSQEDAGMHTWGKAKVGRSVWDADGPNHLGAARIPAIRDTDLSQFGSMLSSGTGPRSDMLAVLRRDLPVPGTIRVVKTGIQHSISTIVAPVEVSYWIKATGTRATCSARPIRYLVKLSVQFDLGNGSTTWFGMVEGVLKSNASPNNGAGGDNFVMGSIDVIGSDGVLDPGIAWYTDNGLTTPADVSILPSYTDITNVTAAPTGATYADGEYEEIFMQSGGSNAIGGEPALQIKTSDPSVTSWATDWAEPITINVENGYSVLVQVGPMTSSNSVFAQTTAWESAITQGSISVNDIWNGSGYVLHDVLVPCPLIVVPSDVTGVSYSCGINEASPRFGSVLSESELSTINSAASIKFANSSGTPKSSSPTSCANISSYPYILVSCKSSGSAVAYKVDTQNPWESSAFEFDYSGLDINTSFILGSERLQFSALPSGVDPAGYRVSSDTPGVIASMTDSGDVLVTRMPSESDCEIYLEGGYNWHRGDEGYYYATDHTATFPEGEVSFDLPGIAPDSLIYVEEHSYLFDVHEGHRTFHVRYKTIGLGSSKVWLPIVRNLETVTVNGISGMSVIYENDMQAYVIHEHSMGDEIEVEFDLVNCFFYENGKIHLSEPAPYDLLIFYRSVDDKPADSGTSVSTTSSWDDRFFVAYSPSGSTPATATIETERPNLRTGRLPGGTVEVLLGWVKVLDVDGAPLSGVTVPMTCDGATIIAMSPTTDIDGRQCFYLTRDSSNSGVATITVFPGDTLERSLEVNLLAEIDNGESGIPWTMSYTGPTVVRYDVPARFTVKLYDDEGGPMTGTVDVSLQSMSIDSDGDVSSVISPPAVAMTIENGAIVLEHTADSDQRGTYMWVITGSNNMSRSITWRVY